MLKSGGDDQPHTHLRSAGTSTVPNFFFIVLIIIKFSALILEASAIVQNVTSRDEKTE